MGLQADIDLAPKIKNADIIISGHSHTKTEKPVILKDLNGEEIIIVQAYEMGKLLGDLKVKVENDKTALESFKLRPINDSIKPDKDIVIELEPLKAEAEKISKKYLGSTSTYINMIRDEVRTKETTGGNFITDAIKDKFPQVDIVLHNGGGIRGDNIISPGDISILDIIEMHPFGDDIIILGLSGKDLKLTLERSVSSLPFSSGGFLQISGACFTADVSKTPQQMSVDYDKILFPGERVIDIKINGIPLEDDKIYKIATNHFIANGGNGYLAIKENALNPNNSGLTITNVLKEYLEKYSLISPVVEDRIKIINIPNK